MSDSIAIKHSLADMPGENETSHLLNLDVMETRNFAPRMSDERNKTDSNATMAHNSSIVFGPFESNAILPGAKNASLDDPANKVEEAVRKAADAQGVDVASKLVNGKEVFVFSYQGDERGGVKPGDDVILQTESHDQKAIAAQLNEIREKREGQLNSNFGVEISKSGEGSKGDYGDPSKPMTTYSPNLEELNILENSLYRSAPSVADVANHGKLRISYTEQFGGGMFRGDINEIIIGKSKDMDFERNVIIHELANKGQHDQGLDDSDDKKRQYDQELGWKRHGDTELMRTKDGGYLKHESGENHQPDYWISTDGEQPICIINRPKHMKQPR